ncbi:TlpA family protein disulfide reductase [Bizionia sediminis]|uniref:TlpA family protein disulfide reductase n=1 Tax=Bizionia sediminis TaxID=1737064 RepID=A0ABW5KTJ1_9FLAO
MNALNHIFALFVATIVLVSCQSDTTTADGSAYFGGEVVNPKSKFVILSKGETILDTLTLDENNRFLYKIDRVERGLYTFRLWASEGLEYQMVLLEPQDSLLFRLNTLEFDESLVYTGRGAKKNNYLINLFLDGEKEDKTILGYSQLPPKEFERRLDSIRDYKLNQLKAFNDKNPSTATFLNLVKGNINYDYYLSKEVYPFVNYSKSERANFESLPPDFYNYRKDINYNYCELMDYFPYYSFLKHHFENIALLEHFKKSDDTVFNIKSLNYNLIKLNLIDSLVVSDSLKNSLLAQTAIEFISHSKNINEYDQILNSYTAKTNNKKNTRYVTNMVNALKNLKPGSPLPAISIIDYNNNELALNNVINKPTVIYFWSSVYRSHNDSHRKAQELKIKYPEINFIAINASSKDYANWKQLISQYSYAKNDEFIFKNPELAKQKLAISPINKVMIVDKNGKIVNAHTNMFSILFEEELLGLLNQ